MSMLRCFTLFFCFGLCDKGLLYDPERLPICHLPDLTSQALTWTGPWYHSWQLLHFLGHLVCQHVAHFYPVETDCG